MLPFNMLNTMSRALHISLGVQLPSFGLRSKLGTCLRSSLCTVTANLGVTCDPGVTYPRLHRILFHCSVTSNTGVTYPSGANTAANMASALPDVQRTSASSLLQMAQNNRYENVPSVSYFVFMTLFPEPIVWKPLHFLFFSSYHWASSFEIFFTGSIIRVIHDLSWSSL